MKKAIIITVVVILALAVGVAVYLRPHSLTDRITEDSALHVTCTTFRTKGGESYNETRTWENISVTSDILELLDEHPYRRSLPFSAGGTAESLLVITVYKSGSPVDSVTLSDSGGLTAGGGNYTMSGADTFIEEFISLIDAAR